jgi:hypothetical protein
MIDLSLKDGFRPYLDEKGPEKVASGEFFTRTLKEGLLQIFHPFPRYRKSKPRRQPDTDGTPNDPPKAIKKTGQD